MNQLREIHSALKACAVQSDEKKVMFFKTEEGAYAAHDRFIGVPVPAVRRIAKDYAELPMGELAKLISSPFNEERLLALVILVNRFARGEEESIYQFYMDNRHYVNNWNLVDSSAHLIVGAYLFDKDKTILEDLATSSDLWDRRIAIVATWYFIRKDDLKWTFKIAKTLLNDDHDLIHKATGWMLREAGKRDIDKLKKFLDTHKSRMPRTMLRYAIEKLDESQRKRYLSR